MKRLNYLFAVALVPMAFAGCSTTDAVGNTDGDDSDGDDDDGTSTTNPTGVTLTTTSTTTTTDGTGTDPSATDPTINPTETATGTTDPTTGPDTDPTSSSSSSGGGCSEDDECIVADDCADPGQLCLGCLCIDDPDAVCPGGWADMGAWGDCLNEADACGGVETAGCVVDNTIQSTAGSCYFPGCDSACDCPEPPDGFDAQVTCGALVNMDSDCYIDCSGGQDCPAGWQCVGDYFCAVGDPVPLDPYDDCIMMGGVCPETTSGDPGVCIPIDAPVDMSANNGGFCMTDGCDDAADCPMPATGDAVVTCSSITGDAVPNCHLDCSNGETCPDDMLCHPDFGICYNELNVFPEYGECTEQLGVCPSGPCLQNGGGGVDPTLSFCSEVCADASTCGAEPSGTGTAVVACLPGIIGGASICALDCSAGGATCPDGMACNGGAFCVNPL